LPEKGWYRCNILQEKPVNLRPCESGLPAIRQAGLGQGFNQMTIEYWQLTIVNFQHQYSILIVHYSINPSFHVPCVNRLLLKTYDLNEL
jgi:hypothetical protein